MRPALLRANDGDEAGRPARGVGLRRNRFLSRGESDLPELPTAPGLAKGETSRNRGRADPRSYPRSRNRAFGDADDKTLSIRARMGVYKIRMSTLGIR
jgi:hypothetical protein